jgi:hypothetical protein
VADNDARSRWRERPRPAPAFCGRGGVRRRALELARRSTTPRRCRAGRGRGGRAFRRGRHLPKQPADEGRPGPGGSSCARSGGGPGGADRDGRSARARVRAISACWCLASTAACAPKTGARAIVNLGVGVHVREASADDGVHRSRELLGPRAPVAGGPLRQAAVQPLNARGGARRNPDRIVASWIGAAQDDALSLPRLRRSNYRTGA